MAEVGVQLFNQYSTVKGMFRGLPSWVTDLDQQRIASYSVYEQIYWNVPEAFKLVHRGEDSQPIYIPSGKQIVETYNRFLAKDMVFTTDPVYGTDSQQSEAEVILASLLDRERFRMEFSANKRFGIIRGDWLWHIYADPDRQEGARISIMPVDPASYFPIHNDNNLDEIVGCHIVEPFLDRNGREKIRRLTYRKETGKGGPSPIIMSDMIFEVDAWGQPGTAMEEKVVEVVEEDVRLPDPINALPVYHIQNFYEPQNPFGSSELRGMERVIAAVNQSVSDEELTLALEGLGVYTTTSGPPIDPDTGEERPWTIAPGRVVEIEEDDSFTRVRGVDSVKPFQDHLKYLHEQIDLGSGIPAVAKGKVDVTTAESGVALAIQLGPILARSGEGDEVITSVMKNLLYDLRNWFIAYEPTLRGPMEDIQWVPLYGSKIPVNRKQKFAELMELSQADPPVVSRRWLRTELEKLGYEFPEEEEFVNDILEELTVFGQIASDVMGSRLDNELNSLGTGEEEEEEEEFAE